MFFSWLYHADSSQERAWLYSGSEPQHQKRSGLRLPLSLSMSHLPLLAVAHLLSLVPVGQLFGANSNHHFGAQKQTSILLQASRRLPLPYGLPRARSSVYVSKGAILALCTEGGMCFNELIHRGCCTTQFLPIPSFSVHKAHFNSSLPQ